MDSSSVLCFSYLTQSQHKVICHLVLNQVIYKKKEANTKQPIIP